MGTDGQAHKDEEVVVPAKSQTEECPDENEEISESKSDRKTDGIRCFQGNRETSEDEPSELGDAVVTASEPMYLVPQLISQPQYLDCDFDVELTAEVIVEDGSSLALLASVTPSVRYQKPGSFLNGQFFLRSALRNKQRFIDCFLPSGPNAEWCSGAIQASGQMQLHCALKTSERVIETAKSPLPSSPSNSPSSPSSAPSSPSSPSSSSPGTNYHVDENRGCAGDNRTSKGPGDFVSSTSSSLVPSSLSVPPSSNPPLHRSSSSTHPCNDEQREGVDNDIYDPFHPTEGEGEREQGSSEDEEEDKYDPFEPTGSPASETEEGKRCMDEENEGESSINSEGNVKGDRKLKLGQAADTQGGPPDSTEIVASSSMFNDVPLELNRKQSIKDRAREQGINLREIKTDSEHSEIEEGEIVGANERGGRQRVIERREVLLPASSSPSYLQGSCPKPERILRVLEGDGFVSVCADEEWEREPVASVGVGDLRRKLTSRRKDRFRSCPSSASMSPSPAPVLSLPLPSPPFPTSPPLSTDKGRSRKSSKSSKDRDRHKPKEERGEKEKRKKRKEGKESGEGNRESKEKDRGRENKEKNRDRERSSRSDSRKRKKRRQSSPEHSSRSHSQNASRHAHSRRSWSSHSEDHHRDQVRDKEKDKERDRTHERDRDRDRWRDDRHRERDRDSKRRDERRRDRDEDTRKSSSRERRSTKRSRGSSDRRDREKEMVMDRDRRRDSRPVVPPSIQDLSGSDLFAIKRTITVTTTTTTTTLPSSPPCSQRRSRSHSHSSDKHHKRKKKRRRRSDDEERKEEEHRSRSRPTSLTPPHYHGYESDRPEIDMLSLDGEALDSDYPSLEDSPMLPPPPEPPLPIPKIKSTAPKASQHHLKKKSRSGKKVGLSESTSSSSCHRPKSKRKNLLSSLSPPLSASSGNTTSLQPTASSSTTKRGRKTGKDKMDAGRSGRFKKLGGSSRKGKLQSKVSVLVREGVSSTTGNSGKLGIDLLGPSGGVVGGPSGSSVVGGSIAVVFRRDNESRSPFLKPCSETLPLPGRVKDPNKTGKQRNILRPSSLTNPGGLKSKKNKPSSATSTSSSASSPTSSLAAKRRRRPGKKPREKGLTVDGSDAKNSNSNCSTVVGEWMGVSAEMQPLVGAGSKPSSPPSALPGPTPSSSSSTSSSASLLPPSSSPPHTSPLSLPPSRDTRESSPDSQTVDSSCKTPEPSFLSEECPGQSKSLSLTPSKSPLSPPSLLSSQIRGESISQFSSSSKTLPPDDQKASPPCSTSLSASVSASLAHSSAPLANDLSSSSSSSVSSSSINKPPPPPPPPPSAPPLPWSLQTGVDCTAGGVLALTALLFKMEEANIASRAKAQEFIQATSQILSQANQNQSQPHASSSVSSQIPPPPSHAPPPGPTPAQFILHSSVPLVSCTKTPPSHLLPGLSMGGGCAQTPPPPLPTGVSGDFSEMGWDNESKDPDKYLKKLHTQERAVEEVKLAIKPYYQRKDINKDEYKDILRKAVHKICHSRTGEINPVKVSNLVKLYVQRYKYFRKHGRKMDEEDRESASMHSST